jgi:hypothetical protein
MLTYPRSFPPPAASGYGPTPTLLSVVARNGPARVDAGGR